MNKKYTIITYGCQMNHHDSEKISYLLETLGYTKEDDLDFLIQQTVEQEMAIEVYSMKESGFIEE